MLMQCSWLPNQIKRRGHGPPLLKKSLGVIVHTCGSNDNF